MPAQLDEPESSLGPSLVLGLSFSVASMVVLLPAFAAALGGQPIGSDSAGRVGGNE
jgi:predicted Kef-type K+ transport protein